jgi:hypothetical protein
MDIQPLCPKEINAFITWKITKTGNRTITNSSDEMEASHYLYTTGSSPSSQSTRLDRKLSGA